MGLEAPSCWLEVSLDAFASNVIHAKRTLAHEALLMVAVKSDAYGHGGAQLAKHAVASGADALAVLDIDTGIHLRDALPDTPMLAWLLSPTCDFLAASKANLTLGISHLWQLEKLARESDGFTTTVHLKIDTGLHRNGALMAVWPEVVARAAELERQGLLRVEGIWSHLADTSIDEDRKSLARFMTAVDIARGAGLSPTILHIAASAAATDLPDARLDMVRVGISVYGVSPFDDRRAEDMGFMPVMSAHARVVEVDVDSHTATLGMGYAHGLHEIPADTGWVRCGRHTLPVISVESDHTLVSLPNDASVTIGDVAVIFGAPEQGSPRAEDWAGWASTIGDEIVTAMSPRVPRRWVSS